MPPEKHSAAFLARLSAVKDKRPKTVIDHILKHGHITTEELKEEYGYNHPPRAAKDVRDQGIPLETFRVKGSDGRSIAAYRFADLSKIRRGFLGGRRPFPKGFKDNLAVSNGCRCHICSAQLEERYLQIDHRVPYEIAGDIEFNEHDLNLYMLLCGSCNRAKSWSCEHCGNWKVAKSVETCQSCYWASPESYRHIALIEARRLDLMWTGRETEVFDELQVRAKASGELMPEHVKRVLRQAALKK